MHRPRNAEEVDEHGEREPDLRIVQKGVPKNDFFDQERDRNQETDNKECDLIAGEDWGADNRANGDMGLCLDELGHRFRHPGEVGLFHGGGILEVFDVGVGEADVGEGIDAEEGKR